MAYRFGQPYPSGPEEFGFDHGFSSSGAVVTGAGTCENRTGLCIRRQQALQGWRPGGSGLKRVSR